MYTDPLHLTIDSPGHLEGNCPFIYLDAFASDEQIRQYLPEYDSLQALKDHYTRGGVGDGTVKKLLFNIIEEELAPIRSRRAEYEKDLAAVYQMLKAGSEAAREVAANTLDNVRKAMKIDYFSNDNSVFKK